MATWVRQGTGTAPSATDADLTGEYQLDNATAPVDFDPAAVNSVRCEWTIDGSGFNDDSWDNDSCALVTAGGTEISQHPSAGGTGLQNVSESSDHTDSAGIPTGLTVAEWEGARVRGDGADIPNEWTDWVKQMGPDGSTMAVSALTVTIDYEPAAAQPVVIQASPAGVGVGAQAANPAPAALAVQASPALLTSAAQAATPTPAALAVQATPAVVATAAQPANPAPAALAVQASPAVISSTASEVNPVALGGPVSIQAVAAVLTAQAQAANPALAALAVQAAAAELTTLAQVVSPVASQNVTITASPAALAVGAQAASPTLTALAVQASPATLAALAQAVDPIRAGLAIQAVPAVLTVAGQVFSPQLAAKAIQATPAILTVSASQVTPLIFVAHIEGNTFVVLDPSGGIAELADRGFAIAEIQPSKTEA